MSRRRVEEPANVVLPVRITATQFAKLKHFAETWDQTIGETHRNVLTEFIQDLPEAPQTDAPESNMGDDHVSDAPRV